MFAYYLPTQIVHASGLPYYISLFTGHINENHDRFVFRIDNRCIREVFTILIVRVLIAIALSYCLRF